VLSALCAPEMSSLDSALETLERNSPSGLLESAFDGVSFSTSARYVFASVVSPDLMEDIRLESALSKESALLVVELEVEEAEAAAISEKRVLVLSELEINMEVNPFYVNFSE
jgi:hypothetical protein